MPVPAHVRAAALAAFEAGHPDAVLLDLLHDTVLDGPLDAADGSGPLRRILLFGTGPHAVRVIVTYLRTGGRIQVEVPTDNVVEVEMISPEPRLRLVERGRSPLALGATARGPVSLVLSYDDANDIRGTWRTAWLTI